MLLCRRHHRLVHEDGHRVFSDVAGQVVFFTPTGAAIAASPPMPALAADPVAAMVTRNRERAVEPDWRSGMTEYRRDQDILWEAEGSAVDAPHGPEGRKEPAEAA